LQKVIAVTVVVVRTAATTRMFPNYYCPLPIDDYFDATKNNEVISQPISVPISKVPILDYNIHDEEIFCNVFLGKRYEGMGQIDKCHVETYHRTAYE
jgi:hypothetical protein